MASVTLEWDAVTEDRAGNAISVTSYRISTVDSSGTPTEVRQVSATPVPAGNRYSSTFLNVPAGSYVYRVEALFGAVAGDPSDVFVSVDGVPAAPANLIGSVAF